MSLSRDRNGSEYVYILCPSCNCAIHVEIAELLQLLSKDNCNCCQLHLVQKKKKKGACYTVTNTIFGYIHRFFLWVEPSV